AMIVAGLSRKLPERYIAEPRVHLGWSIEIDVATFDEDELEAMAAGRGDNGGGVATVVWAPPRPTLTVATDLPDLDAYEVRVYDDEGARRLVAAREFVSPAYQDPADRRRSCRSPCARRIA